MWQGNRFFLMAVLLVGLSAPAAADSCHIVAAHPPSDAEKAILRGDYAQAETLYRNALESTSGDPALTAGLVQVLLRQEKVSDADDVLKAAMTAMPKSAALLVAFAEADYRKGLIMESDQAARRAYDADLCYARVHMMRAKLARINSMYATERKEIDIAHSLDRYDADIWSEWIDALPLPKRIEELRKVLDGSNEIGEEQRKRTQTYLDELEKLSSEPPRRCRISSGPGSTEIPFEPIISEDGTRTAAWALIVKLNEKGAKLQVDTGASGLYISRAIAERAGLKMESRSKVYGIGDRGPESGFTAYVDSIRVGNLEFKDCLVEVSDRKSIVQSDGLVGMDIFSKFLVSVDFPLHKLELSPLPTRPGEQAVPVSLQTDFGQDVGADKTDGTTGANKSGSGDSKTDSSPPEASAPKDRYIAPEMETWTPVFRVGHDLLIPTTLNKNTTKLFIIDTGSQFTSVSLDAASEVSRVHNSDMIVRGVSGRVKDVFVAGNITLQFANKIQDMGDVTVLDFSKLSRGSGIEISGLLGASALKFLTIHMDYRDGLVKFDYDPKRGTNRAF
jgi:predicted aspartyl protease